MTTGARGGIPKGSGHPGQGGFTLIESLVVMTMIGVLLGIASQGYGEYRDRSVPQRGADVVGGYITLTRSHAIQRRAPVTFAIDSVARSIAILADADTLRTVRFGEGADIELDGLTSNFDGNSITFDGRGLCSVCGVAGKAITVTARGTSYEVTVVALGRWKSTLQE